MEMTVLTLTNRYLAISFSFCRMLNRCLPCEEHELHIPTEPISYILHNSIETKHLNDMRCIDADAECVLVSRKCI